MRIADTLLRGGHLSEDALVDAWYSGHHPAHLDTCTLCADRALDMSRWLEQTRDLGVAEADAAFPAERLAAQQSQILRKLEQLDRPAKLLSFPRMPSEALTTPAHLAGLAGADALEIATRGHRVSSRWIAAAAAAGLILGVIGGRLSMWQPSAAARSTGAQAAPTQKAPDTARATNAADLLLDSEDVSQPQIRSLSAIDTLTPQVAVARASTQRR